MFRLSYWLTFLIDLCCLARQREYLIYPSQNLRICHKQVNYDQKTDQNQGRIPERKQPAEIAVHGHPECQQEMDHANPELEFHAISVSNFL